MSRYYFIIVSVLLFLPSVAQAVLPGTCPEGINCNTNLDPNQLIMNIINWLLSITLVLDVLFIILGGFFYITSSGNEEHAEKGKATVVNALVGLIIIILAYAIARMVEQFFLST